MRAPVRDRVLAAIGTLLVVTLLGTALVLGLRVDVRGAGQRALAVFAIPLTPPPSPSAPIERVHAKRARDEASPRNLRAKATAVVAPPPIVIPPAPPPVIVAPKANVGAAAHTGASDLLGPGEGAGGQGDGRGGGGDGGDGDGDDTPPVQITGRLKHSDLPLDLLTPGADYSVGVRFHVETDGRVGDCAITRSSGSAALDMRVCALIRQRFRFRPALDPDGRPFRSSVVETHSWGVDRGDYPADAP